MNRTQVLERIKQEKIVAILRGVPANRIAKTAHALSEGGIRCMEIAINQTNAQAVHETMDCIRLLKDTFGDSLLLGAGTVLTKEQVDEASRAGAEYMISPNFSPEVVNRTKEIGSVSIPGAFTPSEAAAAYAQGADIVKMFPADLLGAGYIKALRGPLGFIPLMAVGGIDNRNVQDFLKAGACAVGVGGNLVSSDAILADDFESITRAAREYAQSISAYRA